MTLDMGPLPPPSLPGHTWRAARSADITAIRGLYQACGWVPDDAAERVVGEPRAATDTLCAVSDVRQVAAFAAVAAVAIDERVGAEARAYLHGAVHPAHRRRGIGTFILRWSEARAR